MYPWATSLLGGDYLQSPADVNKHAESESRLYDRDMGVSQTSGVQHMVAFKGGYRGYVSEYIECRVAQKLGVHFGGPYNKDYGTLGSAVVSPYYIWKLPNLKPFSNTFGLHTLIFYQYETCCVWLTITLTVVLMLVAFLQVVAQLLLLLHLQASAATTDPLCLKHSPPPPP